MVMKFLNCLPRSKFIHIVASLEQVLELNSAGFEDTVGRLKAFEERIKEETQEEDHSKPMFGKDDKKNRGSHNNSRGRGICRGYDGRRRGRGRSNGSDGHKKGGEALDKTTKDYFKVKCWRCHKMGYFVSHCPTTKRRNKSNETQEADALYMHNVVFLNKQRVLPKRFDECDGNTSIWYLDNGACNHMKGKRESIRGKVKFSDVHTSKLSGEV